MGTFVSEAGPDASVVGETLKDSEDKHSMELRGGNQGEPGPKTDAQPISLDGRSSNEHPFLRSAERDDENMDPLKNWGYTKVAEADLANKSNRSPDTQNLENGDGDLPSFSIKRLRRLPLRVTTDQQSSTVASKVDPAGIPVNRSLDSDKEEKLVVGATVADNTPDRSNEAGLASLPPVQAEEYRERKDISLHPNVVGVTHSSGGSLMSPSHVQNLDAVSTNKGQEISNFEGPVKNFEEVASPLGFTGVRNEDLGAGSNEPKNLSGDGTRGVEVPASDTTDRREASNDLPQREGQTEDELGQELPRNNDDESAASGRASETTIASQEQGERWRSVFEAYVSNSTPDIIQTANGLQVRDPVQETVLPEKSGLSLSSLGIGPKHEKEREETASSATAAAGRHQVPEDSEGSGELEMDASGGSSEPAEHSPPGVVQILPPVLANRFGSPEETTDEDDSPRSSEGFAYPGGDSDTGLLPYSGQIMYPARYSNSQTPSGPSILQYSGSMSLRSDSSTTSNRSFAFPILAPTEWNSSPVRMAKADPRYLRRRRRWDGCCFFSLGRSRYKY